MIKTKLQTRLIGLIVMSSVFLIGTFTAIQLNNQLKKTAEHSLYRAKVGALITKDKLQDLFSGVDPNQSPDTILPKVRRMFSSLAESEVIENAVLLNREILPLVTEGEPEVISDDEKVTLEKISQIKDRSRWLFPSVHKTERLATLFIIVQNPYGYAVRLTFSLGNLQQALNEVYAPVILMATIVIFGNLILATLLFHGIISPIALLNQATKDIAGGNLERKVSVKTQDELEELAETFNYMTIELKKMKARAENANPLTKFPGNIIIQEEVENRLKKGEKFVLIYCDLDNFKAFNDKYGVHVGDEAIMLTAEIFKEAVSKEGKEDDFIGHEGGDDFLLLTVPERGDKIGSYIIEEFDKRIKTLYSKEDLKRGYIEAKSRESNIIVKFPTMTISLAGVTNLERKIDSYAQLTNIAADIKKLAKETKGSNLLIDRRIADLGAKHRSKNNLVA